MTAALAIDGGPPVRATALPYTRPTVDDDDVRAVVDVLRSDWLTTGPTVDKLEAAFAAEVGTAAAVAVSSGTAALHLALAAVGVGPGDEVIVPAITFVATANSAVYLGATPVFADVDPDTLLLDPASARALLSPRTRAVLAVDYGGQPCDQEPLRALAGDGGPRRVADSCHSMGAADRGRPVGSLAELSAFSLHATKPVTSAEGGMVTTDDVGLAHDLRSLRTHGVDHDHRARAAAGTWRYEMTRLGYNYRLSDVHCALVLSQLGKSATWTGRRHEIARRYDRAFAGLPEVRPLAVRDGVRHGYHLYVVRLDLGRLRVGRGQVFRALRAEGIDVNVHFVPVHLHPYYRGRFGTRPGQCPAAEAAYETILSLPVYPRMSDGDADSVVDAVAKVIGAYRA
ncbi:MAG TPA: DegT/DnrJ/EryC1/StrS family aminotransferase [Micromonosporaceae bacterium]|nr:DegT/DnrJ/EryC1/StrS family aminotransferase [Micromonosporaceae bacterium]